MVFDPSVYGSNTRTSDARKSAQEFEDFKRDFEAKERSKREEALKPLTVLSAEAAREKKLHDFDQECLWSAPLDTIKSILKDEKRREPMYWLLFFGNERTSQTAESTQKVFSDYIDKLPSRTGFKFSDPTRLVLMAKVQWYCGGVEISQGTLDTMLDTLLKHSCFADGEVEYDANWKVTSDTPIEVQPETRDDFCPVYEGDLATRQQALNDEQQKVWQAFTDSVYRNLKVMLNEEQKLYIYNLMRRRGYSFLNPREYDSARIQAVRDHVLDESLLYPLEALDMYIETHDVNDPEVKRQIVVRQRLINQERLNAMNIHGR